MMSHMYFLVLRKPYLVFKEPDTDVEEYKDDSTLNKG